MFNKRSLPFSTKTLLHQGKTDTMKKGAEQEDKASKKPSLADANNTTTSSNHSRHEDDRAELVEKLSIFGVETTNDGGNLNQPSPPNEIGVNQATNPPSSIYNSSIYQQKLAMAGKSRIHRNVALPAKPQQSSSSSTTATPPRTTKSEAEASTSPTSVIGPILGEKSSRRKESKNSCDTTSSDPGPEHIPSNGSDTDPPDIRKSVAEEGSSLDTTPNRTPAVVSGTEELLVAYIVEEDESKKVHSPEPVFEAKPLEEPPQGGCWKRTTICLLVLLGILGIILGVTLPTTLQDSSSSATGIFSTESPSSNPSHQPTISPIPSQAPSKSPTMHPTQDFCSFVVNLTSCTELLSGIDCASYQELVSENAYRESETTFVPCESHPLKIEMLFGPFRCNETSNIFNEEFDFECMDYNEGIPSSATSSLISIQSAVDQGKKYFEGLVRQGDAVTFTDPDLKPIMDTLNISIYSIQGDPSSETLLQRSVVSFNCLAEIGNQPLDAYGALTFIGFTSVEQSTVGFFISYHTAYTALYSFDIQNAGVTPARILEMSLALDTEPFFYNLSTIVPYSGFVDTNEVFQLELPMNNSMLEDRTYQFLVMIAGISEDQSPCQIAESLSFALDAPPYFQTLNGFYLNTYPEDDDDEVPELNSSVPCQVEPQIICEGRTVHGSVGCRDMMECSGPFLTELLLTFNGGRCPSETSESNSCEDKFGGISATDQEVFVIVQLQRTVLFEQIVSRSETIALQSQFGLGPYLNVLVLTADSSRVLQRQQIWTCGTSTKEDLLSPSSQFSLGSVHGAFQVANVTPSLVDRPLASIVLLMKLHNNGAYDSNITSLDISQSTGGKIDYLPSKHLNVPAGRSRETRFLTESIGNWTAYYDSTYSWTISMAGVSRNGNPCSGSTVASYFELVSGLSS